MADSLWQRLIHGSRRVWAHEAWVAALPAGWEDSIMTAAVTDRFHAKQGRSTGRWIVSPTGPRVYLKRHFALPWWRGLMALLWPSAGWSPAEEERRHLAWADQSGFRVPRVLASGEIVGPGCKLQSFLAVEELVDMLPLHEAIPLAGRRLSPKEFDFWKRGLTAELARIVKTLHARNRFHKDLYLCHFYIPEAYTRTQPAWQNEVFVIDLHRLACHGVAGWIWQIKDLAELLYSSEVEGVTLGDRARFWRAYAGGRQVGFWAESLRWVVVAKFRRYRAHNARRRTGGGIRFPGQQKRSA